MSELDEFMEFKTVQEIINYLSKESNSDEKNSEDHFAASFMHSIHLVEGVLNLITSDNPNCQPDMYLSEIGNDKAYTAHIFISQIAHILFLFFVNWIVFDILIRTISSVICLFHYKLKIKFEYLKF